MGLHLKLNKLWCGPRNQCFLDPHLFVFCFRLHYTLGRGSALQAKSHEGDAATNRMPCGHRSATLVNDVICWQPRWAERHKRRDKIPPTWIDRLPSPGHEAMILFIYLFCTSSNFWGWHNVSRGLVKVVSVTKNEKRKCSHISSSASFYLWTNVAWHFPVSTRKRLATPG